MAKIVAVWGSPNAGMTTFSLMLSKTIYDEYTSKVICIFTDNTTPDMPVMFPNGNKDEINSLGDLLSRTDITSNAVLNHLYTDKSKNNLGFLGCTFGDNIYSYAAYSTEKASELISVATTLSDFVVIDCGSSLKDNNVCMAAIKKADYIFRLCSPDYKSVSFFASQLLLYKDIEFRTEDNIQVMNINENDVFTPVQEISQYFKNIQYTLPYDISIKKNLFSGSLLKTSLSNNYTKIMKKIIEKVV